MKIIKNLLLVIGIIFTMSACSSKPTHINLVVKSTSTLNPDINKVPSPLMLHFYELESAEKFIKFDYWTILAKNGKNLGPDLVSQTKYIITPEQKQTYTVAFDSRTKFLGVVGKFRNIKNDLAWKYVINLEQNQYNFEELIIDKFDIKRVE